MQSSLRRNPDIIIRKSEGVSIARAQGMSRALVQRYFDLLENILSECNLHNKPSNVFNVDETGLQLNNKPSHVLAGKGSKNVTTITSGEKGETVSYCMLQYRGDVPASLLNFKGQEQKGKISAWHANRLKNDYVIKIGRC